MRKGLVFRELAAVAFLTAAVAPVWGALEGRINFAGHDKPGIDMSAITSSIDGAGDSCGAVYMPTLVHERDGSIVGMAYVADGDDC